MSNEPTTNERVKAAIRQMGVTRAEAADEIGVSLDTVCSWLKPATSRSHRPAPLMAARYLELLASR